MSTSTRLRALVGAGLLCGGLVLIPGLASAQDSTTTTTPPPTTTTTTTTTTSAMPEVSAADALLARIAALQCGTTFNTEFGAINDDVTALALAGDPRANEVSGARTDRVEELNFCVVTPTVDDGSVPITSGGQVSVVPEGSAETGEA